MELFKKGNPDRLMNPENGKGFGKLAAMSIEMVLPKLLEGGVSKGNAKRCQYVDETHHPAKNGFFKPNAVIRACTS
jgi:hypothetical protein